MSPCCQPELSPTICAGSSVKSRARALFVASVLDKVYTFRGFAVTTVVSLPVLGWLVGRGVWTRITDGFVDLHWSRVVLAGVIAFSLGQMLITVLTANLLRFHAARRVTGTVRKTRPPVRRRDRSAPPAGSTPFRRARRRYFRRYCRRFRNLAPFPER